VPEATSVRFGPSVRGSIRYDYDTRSYVNVRSKADVSQLNLPQGTKKIKKWKREKLKSKKKQISSEVSVNSPGNPWRQSNPQLVDPLVDEFVFTASVLLIPGVNNECILDRLCHPMILSRDFVARVHHFITESHRTEHSSIVRNRVARPRKKLPDTQCHTSDFASRDTTHSREKIPL